MDYYKLKVLHNKRKITVSIVVFLLIAVLVYYYLHYYDNNEEESVIEKDTFNIENEQVNDNLLIVDIKGYVAKPGVYSFKYSDNARVNDIILKAGGLKKGADTSLINLSKKLEDEMTIIIYSAKEVADFVNDNNTLKQKLELCETKLKNNACISNSQNNVNSSNNQVNINTASKDELMTLSGIGEAKANAIIKYRSENKFSNIEEIKNVEGIGDSLFESIKNNIKV